MEIVPLDLVFVALSRKILPTLAIKLVIKLFEILVGKAPAPQQSLKTEPTSQIQATQQLTPQQDHVNTVSLHCPHVSFWFIYLIAIGFAPI